MKITKKWLLQHKACCSKEDMDRAEKELKGDISLICNTLLKENRFNAANWLITRVMTKKQCIEYAIFAALQVIDIFENEYPKDKRLRLALIATKKYLKNPCEKTKNAVSDAAKVFYTSCISYNISFAANAARAAARTAIYTANEATYTADAAALTVIHAIYAANAAAKAAAYSAYSTTLKAKIIKNGLKILKGEQNENNKKLAKEA